MEQMILLFFELSFQCVFGVLFVSFLTQKSVCELYTNLYTFLSQSLESGMNYSFCGSDMWIDS